MVREDLVNSAVSFLQDPSVSSAPFDKRKAFLESKNLTRDEIDLALSRASATTSNYSEDPSAQYSYQPQQQQQQYSQQQSYPYAPPPPWAYQQPPPPPSRDWRDYFIVATLATTASWGLYTLAKRYVAPLILPPTPPQLESDKASIDSSFARAFTLIEQLSTDTAALKAAEEQRTERLDRALEEVEQVVRELREGVKRREEEGKRLGDEIRTLREAVPRQLDGWRDGVEERLREVGTEMRSLKTLVGNRVGNNSNVTATGAGASSQGIGRDINGSNNRARTTYGNGSEGGSTATDSYQNGNTSSPARESSPQAGNPMAADENAGSTLKAPSQEQDRTSNSGASFAEADPAPSSYASRRLGGKAKIPAWQMAAAAAGNKEGGESGTTNQDTGAAA
ncbi:peroxisomal membrane protein pex14 [Agyrium rufum]|nr:peroxisomal membrane protein pex14 [Agyrium rufum]